MTDERDARDRDRRLVKTTSDEFARGFNSAFGRAGREWANRQGLLLAFVLLAVVAAAVWRYVAG